jgi:rubredoxin
LEGIQCPDCGYSKSFYIDVMQTATVTDDGVEDVEGDICWDDASLVMCPHCDKAGSLSCFRSSATQAEEQRA